MDDDEATSDISDEPEPYDSRDQYRRVVDRTNNTPSNARFNETHHNINQCHAKLGVHVNKGVNHLEVKITDVTTTVNTQSATMAQPVNLVHILITKVNSVQGRSPTQSRTNTPHHHPKQTPTTPQSPRTPSPRSYHR